MKSFLFALLAISSSAMACLHYSKDYRREIKEGTKQALLFHDGKYAHLVIETSLSSDGPLPAELAMVLPFPSKPIKYEEVSQNIFEDLKTLSSPPAQKSLRGAYSNSDIKVHAAEIVGNYNIQPIEIMGVKAGKVLNTWLSKQGFNTMPESLQKTYVKPGGVFLAIRVRLNGSEAALKPLHVTYAAKKVSYPLKFTHDTRTFDLALWVASPNPISVVPFDAAHLPLEWSGNYDEKAILRFPALRKVLLDKNYHVSLFQQTGFNSKYPTREISEDPYF